MKVFRTLALASALLLPALHQARAADYAAGPLRIAQPWARATVAGQTAGGGFLAIANQGADDKLLAIRADVSRSAELHTMSLDDNNVMRMRPSDGIALPAGQTVELKPGGYHVMFLALKAPLAAGSRFPATLVFQKAGEVKVEFEVRGVADAAAHQAMPGMKMDGGMHDHAH